MRRTGGAGTGAGAENFSISAPTVSLPKGGGAMRGIGEKFAANPVTGTGSVSVPIALSPGRGGFGPQLALSYDSGAGHHPRHHFQRQPLTRLTVPTCFRAAWRQAMQHSPDGRVIDNTFEMYFS